MKVNQSKTSKLIYFSFTLLFLVYFDIFFSGYLSKISTFDLKSIPLVTLHYMENTGAAFSILQNSVTFLIIFGVVAIILIFWYLIKHIKDLSMIDLFFVAMLLTGISCNLYERIILGFVRDYFCIKCVNFPVFNVSDVFINISVVVIMYLLITKKYSKK